MPLISLFACICKRSSFQVDVYSIMVLERFSEINTCYLCPFYKGRNWGSGCLNDSPQVFAPMESLSVDFTYFIKGHTERYTFYIIYNYSSRIQTYVGAQDMFIEWRNEQITKWKLKKKKKNDERHPIPAQALRGKVAPWFGGGASETDILCSHTRSTSDCTRELGSDITYPPQCWCKV